MPQNVILTITDEFHNKRLDAALGGLIDTHSRSTPCVNILTREKLP